MGTVATQFAVGDRLNFAEEKQAYTVQAISEDGRWVVCTKPFAPLHTVMYTVIDTANGIRGVDDRVFCPGYETRQACEDACQQFAAGEYELSRRRAPVPLVVARHREAGR